MHNTCLNCSQPINNNYCGNCGQKASTHRYSLKHFIEHDFIHGVWHVDKGILFTIKELFTRPGNSVREYILGKRVNYFSFVTLLLLTATLSSVFSHYSDMDYSILVPEKGKAIMNSFQEQVTTYFKIYLLFSIPFTSFFSYVWFRKAGFNYSEHLVLNSYKMVGDMIALLVLSFVTLFFKNSIALITTYFSVFTVFSLLYGLWFYIQFFSQSGYSKISLFLRSIMVPITFTVIQTIIGYTAGVVTSALNT